MPLQDKIISSFEKLPLDEQITVFNSIKEYLTGELIKAANEAEAHQNKLISIRDSINNGK